LLSEIVNSVDNAFFNGGKGLDLSGPRDPLLGPVKLGFSDPSSDLEFSRDKFSKKAKLSFILIFLFFLFFKKYFFRVDIKMAKKPYAITDSIEQSGLRGMINFS